MQSYTYSSVDKISKSSRKCNEQRIGEFIGPLIALLNNERFRTVAMDQEWSYQAILHITDHTILIAAFNARRFLTDLKIEDHCKRTDKEPDESEYKGNNSQLTVFQQSYGGNHSLMIAKT